MTAIREARLEPGESWERGREARRTAPRTTHADGAETSWTLHFYPERVRPGYQRLPQTTSSVFLDVLRSGDRSKNATGSGGFPFDKASAGVGKRIVDYKTTRIGETILRVLKGQR